ncbi:MAG: mucoidy inhibitor MuiA family protein [Alphaproteobacteria bacterium]
MRFKSAVLSAAILLSVFASQSVVAEVDEFTKFQQQVRNKSGVGLPNGEQQMRGRINAPQTPEELQMMMEVEAQEQQRKIDQQRLSMIHKQMTAIKSSALDLKRQEEPFADSIVAESTISDVTVFDDRAKVTRTAVVDVPAGAQSILFKGLPEALSLDSLRVDGTADGDVKFGAIASKKIAKPISFTEEEKVLIPKMEELEVQMQNLQAEKAAREAQGRYLSAVSPDKQTGNGGKADTAQLIAIGKSLRDGMSDVYKSFVQLDARERALTTDLESLRNEFLSRNKFPGSIYYVQVPVDAGKGAKIRINLTYQVNNAAWEPLYDIHLDSKSNKAVVTQYGLVRQVTGEDWKGVKMTLSTAKAVSYGRPADINPKWIDIRPLAPVVVAKGGSDDPLTEWRQKTEAKRWAMEQEAVLDGANEAPEVVPMVQPIHPQPTVRWDYRRASFQPAQIDAGGFVSEYKIAVPSTILSEGGDVRLMVGESAIEGELQVLVRPERDARAFIVFRSKLQGQSPLYPGTASLFRDGSYAGQVRLPLVRPGQLQSIYFGVDDRVSVRQNTVRNEQQESGFVSPDNVVEREFVTEIENFHETPIKLVVEQAVPASKNEKLVLDISKEKTTQGYTADTENKKGLLQWNLEVPAQSKQELKLSWKLSWPKDFVLSGGL